METLQTIKKIQDITNGTPFDWMTGPNNATRRQALMLILTGEKLPKSQCGVTALTDAMYEYFGVKNMPELQCTATRHRYIYWMLNA